MFSGLGFGANIFIWIHDLRPTSTNIEQELRSKMHTWGHTKRGTDRQTDIHHTGVGIELLRN
jgi:hypothetical protein